MSTSRIFLWTLLAGLCFKPAPASEGAPGSAQVVGAGSESLALLPYGELAWDPEPWVGRPLRLRVQFHSMLADWNPFLTRFGTQDHVGFTAWSDEQRVWLQKDYDDPQLRLHARKDGALAAQLHAARPHERYELVCVVREMFGGRPWAEVIGIERLAQEVPEGSVLHAIRGIEFINKRAWTLAVSQFERALAAPLPDEAKAEFERLVEDCKLQRDSTENRVYRARKRAQSALDD